MVAANWRQPLITVRAEPKAACSLLQAAVTSVAGCLLAIARIVLVAPVLLIVASKHGSVQVLVASVVLTMSRVILQTSPATESAATRLALLQQHGDNEVRPRAAQPQRCCRERSAEHVARGTQAAMGTEISKLKTEIKSLQQELAKPPPPPPAPPPTPPQSPAAAVSTRH